jgi:hypothetical protein
VPDGRLDALAKSTMSSAWGSAPPWLGGWEEDGSRTVGSWVDDRD